MVRRKTRALKLLRTLLLLGILTGAVYVLGWSHLISVKSIAISGTQYSSEISHTLTQSGVSVKIGDPMARVDVRAISRIAQNIEWIKRCNISRNWWSGKLSITIDERTPVARFNDDKGESSYFDAGGAIFHRPAERMDLPLINFYENTADARSAVATWLSALPQELIAGMKSVTVRSADSIAMETTAAENAQKSITIDWGAPIDMTLKVKVFRALSRAPENAQQSTFDLTNPLAPVTR